MCLIVLGLGVRADLPWILAANRDEFHARAAQPLGEWPEVPGAVGGRDQLHGGSWLALHQEGRLAAVTNVRDPSRRHPAPRSRGALVRDFVAAGGSAAQAARSAVAAGAAFDGFNLLLADIHGTWHASNHTGASTRLAPGIHGLSNHSLNTPWPKVVRARTALQAAAARPRPALEEALFSLLADDSPVPDPDLPDTGVGLEWERLLATAFIRGEHYGTRASTVVLADARGAVTLAERRFGPGGVPLGETRLELSLAHPLSVSPEA